MLNKEKLNNLAQEIWKSAESLRGKFKAYDYQNLHWAGMKNEISRILPALLLQLADFKIMLFFDLKCVYFLSTILAAKFAFFS